MHKIFLCFLFAAAIINLTACGASEEKPISEEGAGVMQSDYHFPSEESIHEGTWLTWPHHHTYGMEYRREVEDIWLKMAFALHTGEMIHIVAYDETEQRRITKLLQAEGMDMNRVDFVIAKSDDVWSRDTGPMFVLEGGSVELDGSGTAMLCKSSVVSKSRNPELSVKQAEEYLSRYLGATNFIWLEGVVGEDITDAHIDGIARFYDAKTLLTVSEKDFFELYEGILESDYETLLSVNNAEGEPYEIIELPMTAKNVDGLGYKGSYLNYYVGNEVVLVPVYRDANDAIAMKILSELYSDREIVPIDVTALYQYGGMLHCVTQQQPKEEIH